MRTSLVVLALLVVAPHNAIRAQNMAEMNHAAKVIDGSKTPQLIPDVVAYRLYFVAVSEMPNPTPDQVRRQRAHLGRIGLSDADRDSTARILETFKVQYQALIDDYNNTPEVKSGSTALQSAMLARRNTLVQITRDSLKESLSADGMARFDAHVQREKAHMRVAEGDN
jgi:hypothetical protein